MTVLTAGCLLIMEVTGQNESFDMKNPIQWVYQIVTPFLVWFLGIKALRTAQKNKLTFKQGLMQGVWISLTYALTSPFLFALYYLLINPEILGFVRETYGAAQASIALLIGIDMLVQFVFAMIFGIIYAAIASFFLKTKK